MSAPISWPMPAFSPADLDAIERLALRAGPSGVKLDPQTVLALVSNARDARAYSVMIRRVEDASCSFPKGPKDAIRAALVREAPSEEPSP